MDIKVRRTEPSDAKGIKEVYECHDAQMHTFFLPYPSTDKWEKHLVTMPDNVYAYIAVVDGEVVGSIGFEVCVNPRRRHVASFGMGVKDSAAGQGVGSALMSTVIELADKWLNLKRIELTVFVDNDRAIKLYKKFGFEVEGESPAFAFRNGEYKSVYHMARISSS